MKGVRLSRYGNQLLTLGRTIKNTSEIEGIHTTLNLQTINNFITAYNPKDKINTDPILFITHHHVRIAINRAVGEGEA